MSQDEKLIDIGFDGYACLLFENKAGYSVEEIEEIFSEYGNVIRVNRCGSEFGFRFVRYRTKEEAMRAVKGLNGHEYISLMEIKSKAKVHNENSCEDKKKRYHKDKSHDQTEKADSTRGSEKSGDNQRRNNQPVKNGFGCGGNDPKYTNGEVSREKDPARQSMKSRFNRKFQGCEDSGEKREATNFSNEAKFASLHKLRGMNANTFQPQSTRAIEAPVALSDVPALLPSAAGASFRLSQDCATEESATDEFPPPLIAGVPFGPGPKSLNGDKVEVLRASDVLVANIHSNIGVAKLYKLLREYKPIHVSDIEILPEINVRYCHVYFQTPTNALRAEQNFDGYSLCGQSLIALRPNRLTTITGIY